MAVNRYERSQGNRETEERSQGKREREREMRDH